MKKLRELFKNIDINTDAVITLIGEELDAPGSPVLTEDVHLDGNILAKDRSNHRRLHRSRPLHSSSHRATASGGIA